MRQNVVNQDVRTLVSIVKNPIKSRDGRNNLLRYRMEPRKVIVAHACGSMTVLDSTALANLQDTVAQKRRLVPRDSRDF